MLRLTTGIGTPPAAELPGEDRAKQYRLQHLPRYCRHLGLSSVICHNQLGKQFGEFWRLFDRASRFLTREMRRSCEAKHLMLEVAKRTC
jgi:hypothetical protein